RMNSFLSSSPVWQANGVALIRITFGLMLIYHGQEVFNPELMKGYEQWDSFKGPMAKLLVYAGKGSELVAGIFLLLGLLTRVGSGIVIGTFFYITFVLGHGKFWY